MSVLKRIPLILLLLLFALPVFSMERRGAVVRFKVGEEMPATFANAYANSPARFVEHEGFVYFNPTPFTGDPWLVFGPAPVKPGPPAEFVEIFGPEPVGSLANRTTWQQQLGLWRDNKLPDGADPVVVANAQDACQFYGLGNFLPFRLTNGAEMFFFPAADKRVATSFNGFSLEAKLVLEFLQFGIAFYQASLIQIGVQPAILVPILEKYRLQ